MYCIQSVGICSCLFFGRPPLLLPETCSLTDFAQMWLYSRLQQWPNHFSLSFSRKVSTGFTCASVLMTSLLMWSNLVFPLAHLNILISAEFSLFLSLFFTAQHSQPCAIAGLMIVLKTVFQFHGHLPIAHHPGYFHLRDPPDYNPTSRIIRLRSGSLQHIYIYYCILFLEHLF